MNDLRACFIGDSYFHGTGDDDYLGWVGRLSAAARRAGHNLTHYNLGVRRETSADIARLRYRTLLIGPPAVPDDAQNARPALLSERMGAVAARMNVPYFAFFRLTVNEPQWLNEVRDNDGAHPRATGCAGLAALIGAWPEWRFSAHRTG